MVYNTASAQDDGIRTHITALASSYIIQYM